MQRKEFVQYLTWLYVVTIVGCNRDKGIVRQAQNLLRNDPLDSFKGDFGVNQAAALLRRTTIGYSPGEVDESVSLGLDKTIEKLFTNNVPPAPPINFEFKEDPFAPIGTTWVKSPYLEFVFFEQYRKKSLRTWAMDNIYNEHFSITEQMVLFWLNYFGVSDVLEHKYEYRHIELVRKFAWGNFKELMKEITVDPAMLRFLSGYENTGQSPNENYAREFLELFTVGKGKSAGEGDYTTFTEEDVAAIAKIMSGWKDKGWFTRIKDEQIDVSFNRELHSPATKNLSRRFNNEAVMEFGDKEYVELVEIVFKQRVVAVNICRKIYRWFVYSEINDEIEQQIIVPLAELLEINNFEIKPVLQTLLKSNHFFENQTQHSKIKNPVEFIFGVLKFFPVSIPQTPDVKYNFWHNIFESASAMGMEYLKPPSVAGWKAYYQAPGYYNLWINAATLQNRKLFCDKIVQNNFEIGEDKIGIDVKLFLSGFKNPTPGLIAEECSNYLFSIPLTHQQKQKLMGLLQGDISATEWGDRCRKLIVDGVAQPDLEINIRRFLTRLFSLPEFNLA